MASLMPHLHLLIFEETMRSMGEHEVGSFPAPRHHSWLQILDATAEVVVHCSIFECKGKQPPNHKTDSSESYS